MSGADVDVGKVRQLIAELNALAPQLRELPEELQARLSISCTATVLRLAELVRRRMGGGPPKGGGRA